MNGWTDRENCDG